MAHWSMHRNLSGIVFAACGVVLGLLSALLLLTHFPDPTHLNPADNIVMVVAGVGCFACMKSARQSFTRSRPISG